MNIQCILSIGGSECEYLRNVNKEPDNMTSSASVSSLKPLQKINLIIVIRKLSPMVGMEESFGVSIYSTTQALKTNAF